MLPRFFAPDLDSRQSRVVLPPKESHHLHRVLRLRVDDEVVVFDGRGTAFEGRVMAIGREGVEVALLAPVPEPKSAVLEMTVVQAILKSDAMDEVVRDCTMVGVEMIQPVISERTTVKASLVDKAGERWRRVALASAKQCGRSRLPRIPDAVRFDHWITRERHDETFILLEPAALVTSSTTLRELALRHRPPRAALVIGPEGGWTPRERDLAIASGCTPLSLGPLTLRAESVPLVASAALLALWND